MTSFIVHVPATTDLSHIIVSGTPKRTLELFGVVKAIVVDIDKPPSGWTVTTDNPEVVVSTVLNQKYALPTRNIHLAREHVISGHRLITCNVWADADTDPVAISRALRKRIRSDNTFSLDVLYFLVFDNEDDYLITKIKHNDLIGKDIPDT